MAAVTPWDRHVIPSIDVLVEIMNPSLVLDKMLANKLVTRSEYLSCKQKSPPDQVRYLFIELLPTKPPVAYEQFRQLLKGTEGQEFLLEEYFPPDNTPHPVECPSIDIHPTTNPYPSNPEPCVATPPPTMDCNHRENTQLDINSNFIM